MSSTNLASSSGTSTTGTALFACTKCNGRYPFEELSHAQQLCKDCRGSIRTVKCTYCRTEFQSESRSNSNTICKKCENNVKNYGKPRACEYCNIIAAFIGNKCQRCSNSEKKYGPPQDCEMCKQRCAFDRKDADSKKKLFDGKLLCWLCTISAKRAMAKAKQNDTSIRHTSITSLKPSSRSKDKSDHHHHRHHHHSSRDERSVLGHSNNGATTASSTSNSKRPRLDSSSKTSNGAVPPSIEVTNDHMNITATTQLKEQVLQLQKQLQKKDQELIEKDKKYTELRATSGREEREWREKLNLMTKSYDEKIDKYQRKIADLQKQNVTLTKQIKALSSKSSIGTPTKPFDPRPLESPSDSPN